MSEEDIDSEDEQRFDEDSESDALVAMSDDDSEAEPEVPAEPEEEVDAEGDEDEDDSDGSDDDENEASEEIAPGSIPRDHQKDAPPAYTPSRASSPTLQRRGLYTQPFTPSSKSYLIEPIIALPHPDATHSLAASACLSHFLTGSEDGFIRDYDIFASANGKTLLTAQQRSYSGLADVNLKAGVLRSWWENSVVPPDAVIGGGALNFNPGLSAARSPVFSMVMQADALWGLSGTKEGPINLFTVRHDPGVVHHTLRGHGAVVSSMCLTFDEAGLLSAGWDGLALQWDLNTGVVARKYPSHGAQLTTIAVRPLGSPMPSAYNPYDGSNTVVNGSAMSHPRSGKANGLNSSDDGDAEGDTDNDYDPLFDDEGEGGDPAAAHNPNSNPNQLQPPPVYVPPPQIQQTRRGDMPQAPFNIAGYPYGNQPNGINANGAPVPVPAAPPPLPSQPQQSQTPLQMPGALSSFLTVGYQPPPVVKRTPVMDPVTYRDLSPDIFMTAGIDGQITIWDRRAASGGVGRLEIPDKTPPWCQSACWSADGAHIFAGRRNGTVDVWDMRKYGPGSGHGQPKPYKTLRNPASSGNVVCVTAFPDKQHLVCASQDNLRLWNVGMDEPDVSMAKGRASQSAPFKIIAGHHGIISQILVDPTCKFMITASGNRGWFGDSTKAVIVHSIVPTR